MAHELATMYDELAALHLSQSQWNTIHWLLMKHKAKIIYTAPKGADITKMMKAIEIINRHLHSSIKAKQS